jgi:hypothetical protein
MERFKALVDEWLALSSAKIEESDRCRGIDSLCLYVQAGQLVSCANKLERTILAQENENFMESIVPGFKDLDDAVATDAAQAVQEQTL